MPSIDTRVHEIVFPTDLIMINNLIRHEARATVTFWGSRVVEVNGFSGSIYLDDLARKIEKKSHEAVSAFTENQTIELYDIFAKLEIFYLTTDDEIKVTNCFTRFLVWIREGDWPWSKWGHREYVTAVLDVRAIGVETALMNQSVDVRPSDEREESELSLEELVARNRSAYARAFIDTHRAMDLL